MARLTPLDLVAAPKKKGKKPKTWKGVERRSAKEKAQREKPQPKAKPLKKLSGEGQKLGKKKSAGVKREGQSQALKDTQRLIAKTKPTNKLKNVKFGGSGKKKEDKPNPLRKIPVAKLSTARAAAQGVTPMGVGSKVLDTLIAGTAKAYYETKGGALKKDAKYVKDAVYGIPYIPSALAHPRRTGKAVASDFKERYTPVIKGDIKGTSEQVKKHGGLSYAVDAVPAGAGASKVVGAAAKSGKLGKKAKAVVTEPRRELRVSPGVVRRQKDETRKAVPSFGRAVAQKRRDNKRQRKFEKREAKAQETGKPTRPLLRPLSSNEVVPRTKTRAKVIQKKDIARLKGKAIYGMKKEQGEVLKESMDTRKGLSKPERRAVAYAQQGIVKPADSKKSIELLEKRRKQITRNRGDRKPSKFETDEIKDIDYLVKHPEAFSKKLEDSTAKAVALDRRKADENVALTPEMKIRSRYGPQAELLGVESAEGRSARLVAAVDGPIAKLEAKIEKKLDSGKPVVVERKQLKLLKAKRKQVAVANQEKFKTRTQTAAKKEGLTQEPGYFPHTTKGETAASNYAVGGAKAVQGYKQRTGVAFREGMIDNDPRKLEEAHARGVKIKHNWKVVSDTIDRHSDPKYKGTVAQVTAQLRKDGINPNDVAIVMPNKIRKAREEAGDVAEDAADIETPAAIHSAVSTDKSIDNGVLAPLNADDLEKMGLKYGAEQARVVPRTIADALDNATKPSGAAGRTLDIMNAKTSRAMLATLNVPWVAVDALSGASMNAVEGIAPLGVHFWKAQAWWKKLDPEAKEYLEGEIGVHPRMTDVYQPKLGSAADNWMVNGYRAWRQTPIGKLRPIGRPLDEFLALENALAVSPFRKASAYKHVKKETFASTAKDFGRINEAQSRVKALFTLDPPKQAQYVMKNPRIIEEVARSVDNALGNWNAFTPGERHVLARVTMFYPFLRYSLRLAAYTMPADHPVLTAIGSKIANMEVDERRKLLGGEPPAGFGKFYKDAGKLENNLFERANPLTNALFSAKGSEKLVGVMPPLYGMALNQLTKSNVYLSKPWQVGGEAGFATGKDSLYSKLSAEDKALVRARVAFNQALSLTLPTRELMKLTQQGTQGDDTLPFSPRPIKYKRSDRVREEKQKVAARKKSSTLNQLLQDIGFKYRPSLDKQRIAEKKKKKTGSGSNDPFGGSANPFNSGSGPFSGSANPFK